MKELIQLLEQEYYTFDILQLVAVIEELLEDTGGRIFFEVDAGLSFPPSDVGYVGIDGGRSGECRIDGDNHRINGDGINNDGPGVTVRLPIMNLLGSSSPLPIGFSDYITRGRKDADMYIGFLSIMQNRLHMLWIDAHRKNSLWGASMSLSGHSISPAEKIFEFMSGMPADKGRTGDGRPYNPLLTGLWQLSNRARSAQGLRELLYVAFGDIPIDIEENVGRYAEVSNAHPLGGAARLGKNAAVGTRVYDRTSKFIITIAPLDCQTYKTFMPGGSGYRLINEILAIYLNEPVICDLSVTCKRCDLPRARLGGQRTDGGNEIGRTAVLGEGGGGAVAAFNRPGP